MKEKCRKLVKVIQNKQREEIKNDPSKTNSQKKPFFFEGSYLQSVLCFVHTLNNYNNNARNKN